MIKDELNIKVEKELDSLLVKDTPILMGNTKYKIGRFNFVYRWSVYGEWIKSNTSIEDLYAYLKPVTRKRLSRELK